MGSGLSQSAQGDGLAVNTLLADKAPLRNESAASIGQLTSNLTSATPNGEIES